MGQPPGPHSAPAPMGTTAESGLILDLVARIPWPRWALVAIAVAAAILTSSCLLCVVCCYCRRAHRRKPRDKEAMGLGSVWGATTAHRVQPEVDDVESSPGGAQQWGRLQLSLEYGFGSQEIRVGLKQAVDLRARGPGAQRTPTPASACPSRPGTHTRPRCTAARSAPCSMRPAASACCWWSCPGPPCGCRCWTSSASPGTSRWASSTCRWAPWICSTSWNSGASWAPPGTAEAEQTGELCFSLQYVPGSGRLTVVVLEARGLSLELAEPYVKVQLMLSRRKWKTSRTSARKGTAAPYFNKAFTFLVPFSQIQSVDLVLAIWARGPRLWAEPVGKVALGAQASGQPLQHWADMLAHARRPIAQWHCLRPAGEVDQALGLQPHQHLPLPGS